MNITYYAAPGIIDKSNRRLFSSDREKAEHIIKKVAEYYGITPDTVKRKSRIRKIIIARFISMHFIRKRTYLPLTQIGMMFCGGMDHTTVMNGIKKVKEQMSLNYENDIKDGVKEISPTLLGI